MVAIVILQVPSQKFQKLTYQTMVTSLVDIKRHLVAM